MHFFFYQNSMHFNKLKIQLKACAIHDVEDSLYLVLTYILMMMCEQSKRKRLDFPTSSGIKKSNKRTARIFQVNFIFNLYKKRRNTLILTFLIIKFPIDNCLKLFSQVLLIISDLTFCIQRKPCTTIFMYFY